MMVNSMSLPVILIFAFAFGILGLLSGVFIIYKKYKNLKSELCNQIDKADFDLKYDLQDVTNAELMKTKAGQELSLLLNLEKEQSNIFIPNFLQAYSLLIGSVSLMLLMIVGFSLPSALIELKLFGLLPVSVLFFSLIGEQTHALYNFSNQGTLEKPLNMFVLSPFFGMVSGSILYLAIDSGVGIFSKWNSSLSINPAVFFVVSFVGGFLSHKPINMTGMIRMIGVSTKIKDSVKQRFK